MVAEHKMRKPMSSFDISSTLPGFDLREDRSEDPSGLHGPGRNEFKAVRIRTEGENRQGSS